MSLKKRYLNVVNSIKEFIGYANEDEFFDRPVYSRQEKKESVDSSEVASFLQNIDYEDARIIEMVKNREWLARITKENYEKRHKIANVFVGLDKDIRFQQEKISSYFSIRENWFSRIIADIAKKYSIADPEFLIDEALIDKNVLKLWIRSFSVFPIRVIKYKKMEKNLFELKPFRPNFDSNVSGGLINNFIDPLIQTDKNVFFTINYFYVEKHEFLSGLSLYDNKEVKKELFYLFISGRSKISFLKEPVETEEEIIYELLVECDSLENMLKTGYLKLEYFD